MRKYKRIKNGGELSRENTPISMENEISENKGLMIEHGSTEDWNPETTIIKDNIFILPCLQERRRSGIFSTFFEDEQEASVIDEKENQELSSRSSKLFNRVWKGSHNLEDILPNDMRKSLVCPSFESLAFKEFTECKDLNTVQKWELLINWVLTQEKTLEGGTYILVTHHNRMRGDDPEDKQALLPFVTKNSGCNAYANNFCLRIHINTEGNEPSINFEVAFSGFPDKGSFPDDCENIECHQLRCKKTIINKIGGGDYKYCCDNLKSSINTDIIKNLLKSYATGGNLVGKNIVIYLIRHGNSLHNKPLESSDRLDSSLTYLGIYQGFLLGKYLKEYYPNDFNNRTICLGSSFLSRAQLTALIILKNIKDFEDNPKLKDDYDLLIKNALSRCKKYLWENSKNLKNINGIKLKTYSESVFTGYPPLNNLLDINMLTKDPYYIPSAFDKFIGNLLKEYSLTGPPQGGGNKTKVNRKKYKKKKSKKR